MMPRFIRVAGHLYRKVERTAPKYVQFKGALYELVQAWGPKPKDHLLIVRSPSSEEEYMMLLHRVQSILSEARKTYDEEHSELDPENKWLKFYIPLLPYKYAKLLTELFSSVLKREFGYKDTDFAFEAIVPYETHEQKKSVEVEEAPADYKRPRELEPLPEVTKMKEKDPFLW